MHTTHLTACLLTAFYALPAAADDRAQRTIESQRVTVHMSEEAHGAIVSLVDKSSGRELAASTAKGLLFELEFSTAGEGASQRFSLNNSDAAQITCVREEKNPAASLRWHFSRLGGRPVEVDCTVSASAAEPFVRWRLEAHFPDSLVLENVRFPIVALSVGSADSPDALVLGATKGGVHRRLDAWKPGQSASATQPGSLAAQMACYYRPEVGVLTAALDNRGYRKTVVTTRTTEALSLAWHQPCLATSRFVQDYDIVLTTFHGSQGTAADWRDGADLYKQWAVEQPWCRRTFAEREDLPAWLKEGPAMVRFSRNWLAEPAAIEDWLKEYWKRRFPDGVPLIIAYWGWEKVDTWITPDYFPVFPSDQQFVRLAQLGRELGGHTFLWPSGYHYTLTYKKLPSGEFAWDDRSRFAETARPHAVVGRDGQPLIGARSWLQGGQTATLCPGDPWTIDWLNRTAVGLAERGAELIQVDQVVGGNFPPCYSAEHGHPPGPGLWATDVFRRQLQSMLQECRRVQPEAVVCFEEPNEHFIQEAAVQDYRDWEVMRRGGVEPASVFNYLYHEYLPTFQSNPRAGDRLQAAYCLVNGQIPHLVPAMRLGPGPLLVGGDFERWQGETPAGWDQVRGYQGRAYSGEAARDGERPHGGQFSLRLTNRFDDEIAQVSQNVPVTDAFAAGRTYRLRVWMKTAGVKKPNGIMLGAFTGDMKNLGSWRIVMPGDGEAWSAGEATFTLPAGSRLLRVMLHLHGPGTVWIDDVVLEEVHSDGTCTVVQQPETPDDHELMRQWVELFHRRGRPYLLLGRMLHPPKLDVDTVEVQNLRFPAILHNAFAAPDGSQAVVLVNITDARRSGRLLWRGREKEVSLEPWEVRLLSSGE